MGADNALIIVVGQGEMGICRCRWVRCASAIVDVAFTRLVTGTSSSRDETAPLR